MKTLLSITCLLSIVLLSSCKKDQNFNGVIDQSFIAGEWELRQSQSSMLPNTNHPEGNGNRWKFSGSNYVRYINGNVVKSGNYTIIKDNSVQQETGLNITSGQFTNRIVFDNDFASTKTFIDYINNQLVFLSGYFPVDGGSRTAYARKKNFQ